MKILYSLIVFQVFTLFMSAQSTFYSPKEHSDKWVDGSEVYIKEIDSIKIVLVFKEKKNRNFFFNVSFRNNSSHDFNVDPKDFYYKVLESDEEIVMIDEDEESEVVYSSNDCDTVRMTSPQEQINNLKALMAVGYLLDVKNPLFNRGYTKIDYYKSNLLLKNTIKPGNELSRLMIFTSCYSAKEIELHLPVNGRDFIFTYERLKVEKW